MNLVTASPTWLIVLLGLALAAAAIEDAVRLRISNITCAIVLVLGLVAMGLHGLSLSLWQNVAVCLGILIVGLPAFAAGWLGGGDVKLLAALGLWLTFKEAATLIAAVFMVGGVLALMFLAVRLFRRDKSKSRQIPYGLAIVFGALVTFGFQIHERNVARFPWDPYFTPHSA
jgi:prepilin peptidase CpaA